MKIEPALMNQLFLSLPGSVKCASAENGAGGGDSGAIQSEISALKARLAGTDQELQKTNNTLRSESTRFAPNRVAADMERNG